MNLISIRITEPPTCLQSASGSNEENETRSVPLATPSLKFLSADWKHVCLLLLIMRALMYREEVVAEIAQDGSPLHLYLE